MKKYNNILIIDTEGHSVFNGTYNKLLRNFNNKEECDDCLKEEKEDESIKQEY